MLGLIHENWWIHEDGLHFWAKYGDEKHKFYSFMNMKILNVIYALWILTYNNFWALRCVYLNFFLKIIFFITFQSWRINIWITFLKHMCSCQLFFCCFHKLKSQEHSFEEGSQMKGTQSFIFYFHSIDFILWIFHLVPLKLLKKKSSIMFQRD